jgi:hypothetical protein
MNPDRSVGDRHVVDVATPRQRDLRDLVRLGVGASGLSGRSLDRTRSEWKGDD